MQFEQQKFFIELTAVVFRTEEPHDVLAIATADHLNQA